MSAPCLLIRTDASVGIGTGHVMRCLALAQAWQDAGGHAVFAMAESTGAIETRLRSESIRVERLASVLGSAEDAVQTTRFANESQVQWVAVDGYRFDSNYQRALKASGLKVLFLDDYGHCDFYFADLVLNQNVHANAAAYLRRAPATELLLGLRYSLLRREYTGLRGFSRHIPTRARNVLVTLGGSDPMNLSLRVLDAIPHVALEGVKVRIAVGGSNPHRALLEEGALRTDGCVELLHDVQNMAELIAWADVGLAAAGSVSWEICVLGLPSILIPVAENQLAAANNLMQLGAALTIQPDCTAQQIADAIRELMLSEASRTAISQNARALLDMDGSRRVVAAILSSSH